MQDRLDSIARSIATGEFETAEEAATDGLRNEPDSLAYRSKLAASLTKQLRFDQAAEHWLRILETPDVTIHDRGEATHGLAVCALQLGDPSLVRPYIDRTGLRTSPYPSDRCWPARNLGTAGLLEEAEAEVRALHAGSPDDPFITQCWGSLLLELGDSAGYRHVLAFPSRAFFRTYYPDTPMVERMWEGEDLRGKSIVIVSHGGFGDYFQFVRHVRHLKELGATTVTAVVGPRLQGLIRSAGVDEVVDVEMIEVVRHRSDWWTGTYGLAHAAERIGDRAAGGGYLTAPPSETAAAIAAGMRMRAAGRPCIGLYWHSDMHLGETKSVPLAALAPLFARTDIHWLILQRGFGLRRMVEAGFGAGATVVGEELSFDDTGALIAALDGVATICAWPFHLAGALGIRTWLLGSRVLDGRHLNRERLSVLYPDTARIARQPKCGDWPGAVTRLMEELDALVPSPPS